MCVFFKNIYYIVCLSVSRAYIFKHTHRHDFHHSHNVGAYGTMTCFWDWICGTDKAYREYYARKKEKASSNDNGNGVGGAAGASKKQK